MKNVARVGLLALALTFGAAATAHEVLFGVMLDGPSESPANDSRGIGSSLITFDLDLATLRVEVGFSGLDGNTTAAHIHCCTVIPGVSTIGVATQLPSFTDFPLGVKSGTYDHTFDLALESTYNPAFVAANGGTASGAMNALFQGAAEGRAYLNIHTASFAGGEIRGFLPLVPVPVPAAVWLLSPALAVLGGMRRRRMA